MERKPQCKPPSGAEAQKAFAGHRRTEVECMHAAERAHRGQDVFSHLVVCNFVLGLPRAAHRICGETSGQREPGPWLSALCWAVVEI